MIRPVRADGSIDTGGVFTPIARRRVIDRIASAAMQRVVLIIAPAGYGKSVALRQYLDLIDSTHVRFDVLPDSSGLLGFLRGLSDAFSEIAPDARATLAGAYEKNAASSSPGSDLALWMHSHLKSYRGIIAIDDLHVAQDDREVTRFLSALIDRTKGRVQWILASRSTLGLPIGTWLAYGDSDLAIDEHDLKFSVDEARDAAKAFRLAVRDEELYELLNLTDGWATAMSFALRSSTRSVDLRNISSMTREMIYRYLAEQVYETLDDDERRFIETASLLQRFDVDLMVRSGFDRAAAMLNDLRARVAFIYEIEPDHYRLHDLFRDFVLHQFRLRGKEASLQMTASVARVLAENGDIVRSLRLYAEAGDDDSVQAHLEADGLELVGQGFADEVESALNALSRGPRADRPILGLVRGAIALARGRYSEGEALLRTNSAKVEDPSLRADALLRLALMLANRGENAATVLSDVLSDPQIDDGRKIEARAILAGYYSAIGNKRQSEEEAQAVEAALDTIGDERRLARVVQRLGYAYANLNKYELSTMRCKQAAELATARGLWSLAARAYVQLSVLSVMNENQPSLALWNAQQAASAASRAGDYYDLQTSLLMVLSIETRRGNAERAQQIERQVAELGSADSSRAHYITSSQAQRLAWDGRFSDAHRLFASVVGRQSHDADKALVRALYALTLALDDQSKASSKAVDDALASLETAVSDAAEGSLVVEAARLFIVSAEIVSGRLTVAGRLLKKPARTTHQMGTVMRALTEELARAARTTSYVFEEFDSNVDALREFGFGGYARYFVLIRSRLESSEGQGDVDVSLTPSELRILRSLAAGMSPKDIAAETGRSVYTVQTHVQNLIEKLGCHGRAEAIVAARRRGLLTPGSNGST